MLLCFTLATCKWDWYVSDRLLGTPRCSRKMPKAGRSPTCRLWTADANSHTICPSHAVPLPSPCRDPATALRGRVQKAIFVAWQGNGMVCVNQTRPHCVNQTGKTQSKPLAERHGMGTTWYVWIGLHKSTGNVLSEMSSQLLIFP
jgi:hypothetical protein